MSLYNINGSALNNAYKVDGQNITKAYNLNGDDIWDSVSHRVSNRFTSTLLFDLSAIVGGTQGIACDSLSQNIAQLYSNKLITIDISDGSYVQRNSSFFNFGHGSAGAFANQKVNQSDLYPPLYVSTYEKDSINDKIYGRFLELYVNENSVVGNRAWSVELLTDGVTTNANNLFAFDFDNNIVYSALYSTYSGSTGWGTITAYRITQDTPFTVPSDTHQAVNGNYLLSTPIDTFDIPYTSDVQSVGFFDGLVAILSDENKVIFYDVDTHSEYLTLNNVIPYEREGIGFIENPQTGETDMILSSRSQTSNIYYRYEFILD